MGALRPHNAVTLSAIFVEALAHAVIAAGMRVSWFTLESLTVTIGRAKVDAAVSRAVARICRSELIVVDDGMLPAGQDTAEAFPSRSRCRRRLTALYCRSKANQYGR